MTFYLQHNNLLNITFLKKINLHIYNPLQIIINNMESKNDKMKLELFMKGPQKKIIEQLQKYNNIDFIDFLDEEENNVLHYAAALNYCDAMEQYLTLLRDKRLWRSKQGLKVSNEVIRYKTKIFLNAQNKDGLTALHKASMKGNIKIAQQLQNAGVRQDKQTNRGYSVLHLAAQQNKLDSMIFFRGKIDLNASDNNGSTALHLASYHGHIIIVSYLVNQAQIQLNFKDQSGKTALHIATIQQHYKVVEILLMAGADRQVKDKDRKTALHYANQSIQQLLQSKQNQCSCNPDFIYQPKKKQNIKKIVLYFAIMLALIAVNFWVFTDLVNESKHFFINIEIRLNSYYLSFELAFATISILLALYLHFRKSQKQKISLHNIEQNIEQSRDFCFVCQTIKKQLTKHCPYCNQCFDQQFKHSHFLGRCIDGKSCYFYLGLLIMVNLLLIRQIMRGIALYLQITGIDPTKRPALRDVLVNGCDWLCMFPLLLFCYKLGSLLKYLCDSSSKTRKKNWMISDDLSTVKPILEFLVERDFDKKLKKQKDANFTEFSTSDILYS